MTGGGITERMRVTAGGTLGIGTANPDPNYQLEVNGRTRMTLANGGEVIFGNPSTETGMSILRGGNRADLRFDGATVKLLAGLGTSGAFQK